MVKYRKILKPSSMRVVQRDVAFFVGCATSTVQDVLRAARAVGLEWPFLENVDDATIHSRIYLTHDGSDPEKAVIDHAWIDHGMRRPGVTTMLLWNEHVDVSYESCLCEYVASIPFIENSRIFNSLLFFGLIPQMTRKYLQHAFQDFVFADNHVICA